MIFFDEERRQYAKYKWEFLRRNPEYIKDYKNFQGTLKNKYGGIPSIADLNKEKFSLCEKWKIIGAISPDTSYDTLIDTFVPKLIFLPSHTNSEYSCSWYFNQPHINHRLPSQSYQRRMYYPHH